MNCRQSFFQCGQIVKGRQFGFSLIELMVAMTIGLLLTVATLTLYLDISRSNKEMEGSSRMMENGRFALQILQQDVSHAGFWGEVDNSLAAPTAVPDLCSLSANGSNLMGVPVQGLADLSVPSGCDSTTYPLYSPVSGESILAVTHANTCFRSSVCEEGDTGPHIQVSTCSNDVAGTYVIAVPAGSVPGNHPLKNKSCVDDSVAVAADYAGLRKVVSSIYYVALDPGNDNAPTLMRASLVNGLYEQVPLVEGVERMHVEYGVDSLGRNGLAVSSSNPADGSADGYIVCPVCTVGQLSNVVSVKVNLLVRALEETPGYTDTKTYELGGRTVSAPNDGFKRHVFTTTIRLVNPSSRREIP